MIDTIMNGSLNTYAYQNERPLALALLVEGASSLQAGSSEGGGYAMPHPPRDRRISRPCPVPEQPLEAPPNAAYGRFRRIQSS